MKRSIFTIKKDRGFILLIAVLVSSIILAISMGIYALSIKEVILASFLKQSSKAFGAADRGVECILYWDASFPQNGYPYTLFSTSTAYAIFAGPPPLCDTQRINNTAVTGWAVINTPTTGQTNFSLTFPDGTCADLEVDKLANGFTTITSNGYNDCNVGNSRRTQRTIQVTGNF